MDEMTLLKNRVQELERVLSFLIRSDHVIFQNNIRIGDGKDIQLGKGTGTKIGTSTTQKLSVYGVTPVIQQSAISAPSGGATIDSQARTAINSIRAALTAFGITA